MLELSQVAAAVTAAACIQYCSGSCNSGGSSSNILAIPQSIARSGTDHIIDLPSVAAALPLSSRRLLHNHHLHQFHHYIPRPATTTAAESVSSSLDATFPPNGILWGLRGGGGNLLVPAAVAAVGGAAATALALHKRGDGKSNNKKLLTTPSSTASNASTSRTTTTVTVQERGVQQSQSRPDESVMTLGSFLSVTPKGMSVFYMALGMAFHYFGYSLARSITVALFTSTSAGFAGISSAFPLAMALVSPCSLGLLMGYGKLLNRLGPHGALTYSTLFCSLVIGLSALALAVVGTRTPHFPLVQCITGPLLVFRESYVQLLTSQHWSFMASVLTPSESARWFGPIAGLTSIASALAGIGVEPLVQRIGLANGLFGTSGMLLMSVLGTHQAYQIAHLYDFTPHDHRKVASAASSLSSNNAVVPRKSNKQTNTTPDSTNVSEQGSRNTSIWSKACSLFQRVPVLKALFLEILASQGLATVLNVCFVAALTTAIPDDEARAGWVGVYFAVINIITMILQFLVLPPLMTILEPRVLWRALPVISLCFTMFQSSQKSPTLEIVSASLLVMKVSEYSARRLLDEMVFVPLDFESRFLGKEVIGVFGYRLGKSLMSLALSGLSQLDAIAPSGSDAFEFGLQQLSWLSTLVALTWMKTAWSLSNLVPTRLEAQTAYDQQQAHHHHHRHNDEASQSINKKKKNHTNISKQDPFTKRRGAATVTASAVHVKTSSSAKK